MDGATGNEEFKKLMTEWVEITDQLKKSEGHLKKLKNRKSELQTVLNEFMKTKEVDVVNITDGKVLRRKSKKTQALTRDHIRKCLCEYLNDETKANEATELIFSSRQVSNHEYLKRTHKQKNDDE